MVSGHEAFSLLRKGRPIGPTNEAAVALLNAVDQMASINPLQVAAGGRAAAESIGSLAPEPKYPTLAAFQAVMAQLAELRGMVDAANSSVAEGLVEELDRVLVAELLGPSFEGAVAGDLIVLDGLG